MSETVKEAVKEALLCSLCIWGLHVWQGFYSWYFDTSNSNNILVPQRPTVLQSQNILGVIISIEWSKVSFFLLFFFFNFKHRHYIFETLRFPNPSAGKIDSVFMTVKQVWNVCSCMYVQLKLLWTAKLWTFQSYVCVNVWALFRKIILDKIGWKKTIFPPTPTFHFFSFTGIFILASSAV